HLGEEHAGPGPLDAVHAAPASSSLASLAAETFVEGCVGELVAALVLRQAARAAHDAGNTALADLLAAFASDEERHAELAYRTLRWAIAEGGATVRDAVADTVSSIESSVEGRTAEARALGNHPSGNAAAWGLLSAVEHAELRRSAVEQIAL